MKGGLSILKEQGGKGTGNSRDDTDKGTETYKSIACLGTAGNQRLEEKDRGVGVGNMIRDMKLT